MTTQESHRAPTRHLKVPGTGPIVAGVDGSRCARNAARWAAAEAVRRPTALHLVHAYHLTPGGVAGVHPYPPHLLADLREEGAAILADAVSELHGEFPELPIDTTLVYGDPATVLRHVSAAAALTVVGTRSIKPRSIKQGAMTTGSVAAEIAKTARVPVAVIHPGTSSPTGPIVVGVDGSPTSAAAIGFAFRTAAARKAKLVAVHCWTGQSLVWPLPSSPAGIIDPLPMRDSEQIRLGEELERWTVQYPDVDVEQAVIHGAPGVRLLEYAPFAQLIVAGSRGQNTLTSKLLGSTGQALIAYSACPVVIVRAAAPPVRST